MNVDDIRIKAKELVAGGEYPEAVRLLSESIEQTTDRQQRIERYTDLINYCVSSSRHRDAIEFADRLTTIMDLPRFSPLRTNAAAMLLGAAVLSGNPWITGNLRRLAFAILNIKPQGMCWDALRAMQFAYFWENISKCVYLAILQVGASNSQRELLLSLAWFGYSLSYKGMSPFGVGLIRLVIKKMHASLPGTEHATERRTDLGGVYPLLGLAYFMNGRSQDALRCFSFYDRIFKNAPDFYKLLTLTARINLHISEGNLQEASRYIGECFSYSFALDKSRHHIQIYGASSCLMAAEGREKQARSHLARAWEAAVENDNNLDYTIYYRYAVVADLCLGDTVSAKLHLTKMRKYADLYGRPILYHSQYLRMRAASVEQPWALARRGAAWIALGVASCGYLNGCFLKIWFLGFWEFISKRRRGFWETSQIADFLKARLYSYEPSNNSYHVTSLSERIGNALLNRNMDGNGELSLAGLSELLKSAFPVQEILHADSLRALVDRARNNHNISGFNAFDSDGKTIRVPLQDNSFLLGISLGDTDESNLPVCIGLIVSGLNYVTLPIAEASFRLIVSDFYQQLTMHKMRELAAQNRELVAAGHAAQMIAHDIRHPFSVLKYGMDFLSNVDNLDQFRDVVAQLVKDVEKSRVRVNGLLADIMSLGRAFDIKPVRLMPESLVSEGVERALTMHGSGHGLIESRFNHKSTIFGDSEKLSRVITNVVLNALEAMSPKGKIYIETRDVVDAGSAFVEVSIKNSGSAINQENLPRVFDAFFTFNKASGTGLGLAIVKKIVDSHRGTINCHSDDDHVTFVVRLPLANDQVSGKPVQGTGSKSITGKKVAIVEDNMFIREAWINAIGEDIVLDFSSVEEFLATLRSNVDRLADVSCIITDMNFDDSPLNGRDLVRAVKSTIPHLPVVLASDMQLEDEAIVDFTGVMQKDAVTLCSISHWMN